MTNNEYINAYKKTQQSSKGVENLQKVPVTVMQKPTNIQQNLQT